MESQQINLFPPRRYLWRHKRSSNDQQHCTTYFRFFHSKKYSFNILAACSESYIVWRNAKDESNFIGIKFEIEIICLNSHTRRSRRSVSVIPTVCCCLGLFVFTLISTIGEYRKSQHDKLLRGSHSNHSYTEHEQINSIISCERTF